MKENKILKLQQSFSRKININSEENKIVLKTLVKFVENDFRIFLGN